MYALCMQLDAEAEQRNLEGGYDSDLEREEEVRLVAVW